MMSRLRKKANVARRKMSVKEYVLLSLSCVFVGLSLFALILVSFFDDYFLKTVYSFIAILFITVSYVCYRKIRSVDFLEFLAVAVVPARKEEKHFVFDVNANVLFLGILFILAIPVFQNRITTLLLVSIGGILLALALAGYFLIYKKLTF